MPKTIKNVFIKKLTFERMIEAHYRAVKGKRNKKEIINYEIDLETNITNLINNIKKNTYKQGKYREFIVYEPKQRLIKSLPYQDRIVHQWYVEEFIKDFYYKRFIKDTYACIKDRGTHKAVDNVQKYMRKMKRVNKNYYVLKCDIKKYFYNIDKEILINILGKSIKDIKLLNFTKLILEDGNKKGIPIGNYTSQWFANIYLNELDHYVKDFLRIKYYVRYMDDFIILLDSKNECKDVINKIKIFLKLNLHLELNKKSRYYPNKLGIDFCGYKIFETHRLLRKRSKKKIKKKIKVWNYLKMEERLDSHKMLLCWNSWIGHANHSNSYNFINKIHKNIIENENLKY